MKIKVYKKFWEKLTLASLCWKPGLTREKFLNIILSLLVIQRESKKVGFKNAEGKTSITVSQRNISSWYKDIASQKKFRRVCQEYGIVVKDHSWVTRNFAESLNQEPRSNLWHITDPECLGEVIEVELDLDAGLFGIYKKEILKAHGSKVNLTDEFSGSWAIDAYDKGEITFSDFIEVGKVAHNILKGQVKSEKPSCRIFDSVSLCKKTLREKVFINSVTKRGMKEVYDIPAAITITAPVGMTALDKGNFTDDEAFWWADSQEHGILSDPYELIFKKVLDLDKRDLYQSNRKWNKSARKILKIDLQIVVNCNSEYLKTCQRAYNGEVYLKTNEYFSKVRQWVVWNAIQHTHKGFFEAVKKCKDSGISDAFYRLHTFGEKLIMDYAIGKLKDRGITVHRVHDALWTTDDSLLDKSEVEVEKVIGKIIKVAFQNKNIKDRKIATKKLASSVSKNIINWVYEGIKG